VYRNLFFCALTARLLNKFVKQNIAGQTKQKLMFGLASNVLPLHFVFSSSQNSNVDNFLRDLHNPFKILSKILSKIFRTLVKMVFFLPKLF
jgi:hypothetical protein